MTEPYTMHMCLCDENGMVTGDYLAHHNRLAEMSAYARGRTFTAVTEPFACTGSAHLAGEHIMCTSAAHAYRQQLGYEAPRPDAHKRRRWVRSN